MKDWIDTLFLALPKSASTKFSETVIEEVPRAILNMNIRQLMVIHKIKNAQALSNTIESKGLSLSKSQIQRALHESSDPTGSTLIKLAAGLGLPSEDFFYLLSPQGFDAKGIPVAKYSNIDQDILIDCAQDAYTALAYGGGDFNVEQFVLMAITGYRTIARRRKDD